MTAGPPVAHGEPRQSSKGGLAQREGETYEGTANDKQRVG